MTINRVFYGIIVAFALFFSVSAHAETTEYPLALRKGENFSLMCNHFRIVGLLPTDLMKGRTPRQQIVACAEDVLTAKKLSHEDARHLPVGFSFSIRVEMPRNVVVEEASVQEALAHAIAERDAIRASLEEQVLEMENLRADIAEAQLALQLEELATIHSVASTVFHKETLWSREGTPSIAPWWMLASLVILFFTVIGQAVIILAPSSPHTPHPFEGDVVGASSDDTRSKVVKTLQDQLRRAQEEGEHYRVRAEELDKTVMELLRKLDEVERKLLQLDAPRAKEKEIPVEEVTSFTGKMSEDPLPHHAEEDPPGGKVSAIAPRRNSFLRRGREG